MFRWRIATVACLWALIVFYPVLLLLKVDMTLSWWVYYFSILVALLCCNYLRITYRCIAERVNDNPMGYNHDIKKENND
jgi:uncharacterized membrane protein YiaA